MVKHDSDAVNQPMAVRIGAAVPYLKLAKFDQRVFRFSSYLR